MKESFIKFISNFDFEKIAISDLHKSFTESSGIKISKQEISKMLALEASKKGYELIQKSDGKKRYYTFLKKELVLTKEMLLSMNQNESIPCNKSQYNRDLVKSMKYYANGKFKIKECEDGITRIFRVS